MTSNLINELTRYSSGLNAEILEGLAEFSGIGLFSLHVPSGQIKLNHNITKMAGYEPGELPHTGNTKEMLTFRDDIPRMNACMASLFNNESDTYDMEYRMRRKDGSIVYVRECAIVYERDEEGRPVSIAAVAQDLSRLQWAEENTRRMQRENKMLARGLDAATLGEHNRMLKAAITASEMIIGGYHQDYETVLRQALQFLGESVIADCAFIIRNCIEEEDDGQSEGKGFLRALWSHDDYPSRLAINSIFDYEVCFPDWRNTLIDGNYILKSYEEMSSGFKALFNDPSIQSVMISPLYLHGEFWGLLGFNACRSNRDFRADEAEIMTAGAMIIASSVARNETFKKLERARAEAMASTKAKGEFLSRMSHEIRTPMNAIIGMTTIAKSSENADRMRYCLDKVDASSRQLLSLINDVLDMSKIESGKLEITHHPFDFEKMIQNVINVIQVKLDEKRQTLKLNMDSIFSRMIISDELRISQVLINLLSNAVKFTPADSFIRLTIRAVPIDSEHAKLHISVADTGIGIDPKNKERLFQSFEQADGSINRTYGGTGLGLSISQKIVELLGGEIDVESEPNVGSNFFFDFAIKWGEKLVPAALSEKKLRKLRILVADDAPDVLDYFKNILNHYSLHCDTASCGSDALTYIKEGIENDTPYDIVFLDWNMPDMCGSTTAKTIRLLSNDIIIVMISVSDWADIENEARASGVNNFLSKPVLPSMLYNTIVKLSDRSLITRAEDSSNENIDWTGKTILMAEDIEINREIIHALLKDTNVSILDAADGLEAVELFSCCQDKIDLILMDMQMPKMDGITATQEIRTMDSEKAKCIPIVAMTANAFKEDVNACLSAGMNTHLAKPLDVSLMLRTLNAYLN